MILNVAITESQWAQAALPIKMGGLGIHMVSSLAFPSFLPPSLSNPPFLRERTFPLMYDTKSCYHSGKHKQGSPSSTIFQHIHKTNGINPCSRRWLNSLLDAYDQARLKAVSAPHAGDWLYALPITSCGIILDDEATRVAVGLRLGMELCEPHTCACGTLVTTRGSHGLACTLGFGRIARHSVLNNITLT